MWIWAREKRYSTRVIFTSNGPVQGNVGYSRDRQVFWQFLGIPFAKAPVGDLKFAPPQPASSWESTKQVIRYPPKCAQYDGMITLRITGQLDCLYLNVFVGNPGDGLMTVKKPVLVYIHGGGFFCSGANDFHPDYFMDHDVVLVVINYRLGPYGFLNLGDDESPKNVGLLDQTMALKWVQTNIARFSGDPERVTLFGQSAGAVSTHLHILSPLSRGLFHKAFMHSGHAISPWAFSQRPEVSAKIYGEKIGCLNETGNLMDCFKRKKWRDLVKEQHTMLEPLEPVHMFLPSVDGHFTTTWPVQHIKNESIPKIPIMIGVNPGEGSIRSGRFEAMPELIPELDEKWGQVVSNMLILDKPIKPEYAVNLREKYFHQKPFSENKPEFVKNLTALLTLAGFLNPTHRTAIAHAKNGAPVHLFVFNYTSEVFPAAYSCYRSVHLHDWLPANLRLLKEITIDWLSEHVFGGKGSRKYGVSHGDDLLQMWNLRGMSKWLSGPDKKFSKAFIQSVVDFAADK